MGEVKSLGEKVKDISIKDANYQKEIDTYNDKLSVNKALLQKTDEEESRLNLNLKQLNIFNEDKEEPKQDTVMEDTKKEDDKKEDDKKENVDQMTDEKVEQKKDEEAQEKKDADQQEKVADSMDENQKKEETKEVVEEKSKEEDTKPKIDMLKYKDLLNTVIVSFKELELMTVIKPKDMAMNDFQCKSTFVLEVEE